MTRWPGIVIALTAIFVLAVTSASAKGRVDQSFIGPSHGSFNLVLHLKQTFRPEATTLTGVNVALTRMGQGPTNVTLTVRYGSLTGPAITSSTRFFPDSAPGQPSDFDADIRLEHFKFDEPAATIPGQIYVIQLDADSGGQGWVNVGYDGYPEGNAYWGSQAITAWDFMFQTCGDGDGKPCKEKTQYVTSSGEIRPNLPKAYAYGKNKDGCIDFSDELCDPF